MARSAPSRRKALAQPQAIDWSLAIPVTSALLPLSRGSDARSIMDVAFLFQGLGAAVNLQAATLRRRLTARVWRAIMRSSSVGMTQAERSESAVEIQGPW